MENKTPPPDLRPTCLHSTPCPKAQWKWMPFGAWVCQVCHPPAKRPEGLTDRLMDGTLAR